MLMNYDSQDDTQNIPLYSTHYLHPPLVDYGWGKYLYQHTDILSFKQVNCASQLQKPKQPS